MSSSLLKNYSRMLFSLYHGLSDDVHPRTLCLKNWSKDLWILKSIIMLFSRSCVFRLFTYGWTQIECQKLNYFVRVYFSFSCRLCINSVIFSTWISHLSFLSLFFMMAFIIRKLVWEDCQVRGTWKLYWGGWGRGRSLGRYVIMWDPRNSFFTQPGSQNQISCRKMLTMLLHDQNHKSSLVCRWTSPDM